MNWNDNFTYALVCTKNILLLHYNNFEEKKKKKAAIKVKSYTGTHLNQEFK